MERAATEDAALTALAGAEAPSIIIAADGAPTRSKKLAERVINCLWGGSTVILAGCFSSMVNEGQFNRFFAKIGLPWARGSYFRDIVKLRIIAVGPQLSSRLPATYSQKTLFVKNVERSAVWYAQGNNSAEAAVVMANVGQGKLGYMGDVNGEEEFENVVLAMCGFEI